jgi:hypothetical protein
MGETPLAMSPGVFFMSGRLSAISGQQNPKKWHSKPDRIWLQV